MDLQEGRHYRYLDLMQVIEGGSHAFYLPFRGSEVFAAFLNPSYNPDAPSIILVGQRPRIRRAGLLLHGMSKPIPVFVKQSSDDWRYEGMYRSGVMLSSEESAALASIAHRADVAFALTMDKVEAKEVGSSAYLEGPCGQVTRNAYERSVKARSDCLNYHGRRCAACDLDFGEEYGERGYGFIHVHHLNPLYKNAGLQPTDPVKDLRPVCPNCHAMLHAGGKLMTPQALRELYWSEASRSARRNRLALMD